MILSPAFIIDTFSKVLSALPISFARNLGKAVGSLSYYIFSRRRKIALNNLAQAHTLNLSNAQIKKTARKSFAASGQIFFESLALYNRKESSLRKYFTLSAPDYVKENQGPKIFFICHKGNWEGVFLYASLIDICHAAVARALPNPSMQKWITAKRSRFNSQMISKTNGIKEMIGVLKSGRSLGLVADQAYPESPYHSPLFGTRAYSVQTPALLAKKLNVPVFFNDTYYADGKWHLDMSEEIWPDPSLDRDTDVKRMMDALLAHQEKTISKAPHEWMWYHQRWKQGGYGHLPKRLRLDQLLVILPLESSLLSKALTTLKLIRKNYPKSFITVLCPKEHISRVDELELTVIEYEHIDEVLIDSYLYQLVFNLSSHKGASKYYLKRGAHKAFDRQSVESFPFI